MASKAIKRRPYSSETDKSSEKQMETTISHPVTEPLLGNDPREDKSKRYEPATWSDFWDGTRQECLRWAHLLSIFIAQPARKIGRKIEIVETTDALKELWRLAYPNRQLPPLKSDLWKEMGWQNSDPSTDFRAGGFMSLENLIYFARNYPVCF
nr:unnamed protein product [Digitaria exilis]